MSIAQYSNKLTRREERKPEWHMQTRLISLDISTDWAHHLERDKSEIFIAFLVTQSFVKKSHSFAFVFIGLGRGPSDYNLIEYWADTDQLIESGGSVIINLIKSGI